ncbi:17991_t:CDS:1, partial [Cetraspora pellucida]
PTFYPLEPDCNSQTYVICPPTYREAILDLIQNHFDMHPLIPVDAQ